MFNNTGIYIIENIITGICYIGSTRQSFSTRFSQHLSSLRRNRHHSIKLQRSFSKHGESSFRFRVLEITTIDIRDKEKKWIDKMIPFYNMTLTVDGGVDNHSYNTRLEMSRLKGGKSIDICNMDGEIIKTVNFQNEAADYVSGLQTSIHKCLSGKSNKHKGFRFKYSGEGFKFVSKEKQRRANISKTRTGHKHTEKAKELMSKATKGISKSHEHVIKMSRARFNGTLIATHVDGTVLEYLSVKECVDDLNINRGHINRRITKELNPINGYNFKKITNKGL